MAKSNNINSDAENTVSNSTFNGNLSARPKGSGTADEVSPQDSIEDQVDFGEMNAEDAKASGYTDEKGRAVSKAKQDVVGSPTGAYTDIGAGRSSAVHHVDPKEANKDRHH
jgi:hypothetical protein